MVTAQTGSHHVRQCRSSQGLFRRVVKSLEDHLSVDLVSGRFVQIQGVTDRFKSIVQIILNSFAIFEMFLWVFRKITLLICRILKMVSRASGLIQ
jgi:hypothetical protein